MIVTCSDCGTLQRTTVIQDALVCANCSTLIERPTGRSVDLALATAASTFLLLLPADTLTLLSVSWPDWSGTAC